MDTSSEMNHKGDLRVMLRVQQPLASCITDGAVSVLAAIGESKYAGGVVKPAADLLRARRCAASTASALVNEHSVHMSR